MLHLKHVAAGWGNNELEIYQEANAQVVNGALVITAAYDGRTYTSARMRTIGLHDFTPNGSTPNGIRVAANILLPEGAGLAEMSSSFSCAFSTAMLAAVELMDRATCLHACALLGCTVSRPATRPPSVSAWPRASCCLRVLALLIPYASSLSRVASGKSTLLCVELACVHTMCLCQPSCMPTTTEQSYVV